MTPKTFNALWEDINIDWAEYNPEMQDEQPGPLLRLNLEK